MTPSDIAWMIKQFFCSCDFSRRKKFCVHLAAGEAFLKNDEKGKELLLGLEQYATESQETKEKVSFGSLFLDQVLPKLKVKRSVLVSQQPVMWTTILVSFVDPSYLSQTG